MFYCLVSRNMSTDQTPHNSPSLAVMATTFIFYFQETIEYQLIYYFRFIKISLFPSFEFQWLKLKGFCFLHKKYWGNKHNIIYFQFAQIWHGQIKFRIFPERFNKYNIWWFAYLRLRSITSWCKQTFPQIANLPCVFREHISRTNCLILPYIINNQLLFTGWPGELCLL